MEQSTELKEFILRLYQALSAGDATAIEEMTSTRDGVVFIGTDPDEWWAGYANITRALRTQMDEMGGGIPIVPGDPLLSCFYSINSISQRQIGINL